MSENVIAKRVSFSHVINSDKFQAMINNSIKDKEQKNRFVTSIVSAVSCNPALQGCAPHTILSGALLGESLNLSPSPQLGHYYLVPFKDKKNDCVNAQFILGYKGYIQLAERSGQYKDIDAFPVYEGEYKGRDKNTRKPIFEFIEDDEKRESLPVMGYYAYFELLNGFTKTLYWSRDKMISHADKYSPSFSKDAKSGKYPKVSFEDYLQHKYPSKDEWLYSSYWYKNFDEMAQKTMLKQLISKWGIISIDIQTAVEGDGAIVNESGDFIMVEEEDGYVSEENIQEKMQDADEPVSLSDL